MVAGIYWPQDQWVALLTATFMIMAATLLPGFWARIAVLLALVFGYLISWLRRGLRDDQLGRAGPGCRGHRPRPAVGVGRGERGRLDRLPERHLQDGVDAVHAPSFA